MTQEEILAKIAPIFKEVFNDDEMDVNMDLTADDIDEWSSISQTLMLTEVEKEFGIVFKLREVAEMDNVAAIVGMIESKLG